MRIKFIDLNKSLVEKVKEIGIQAYNDDIFKHHGIIVSASNPKWTFSGGLDYWIQQHYQQICREKQEKGGGNERIGNIIFTITVNGRLEATEELVSEAIDFAIKNTKENETLLLSGLGTGVGGLPQENFIKIIKQYAN